MSEPDTLHVTLDLQNVPVLGPDDRMVIVLKDSIPEEVGQKLMEIMRETFGEDRKHGIIINGGVVEDVVIHRGAS